MLLSAIFKTIRLEQWTKNLFIFAGLIFSGNLIYPKAIFKSITAFFIFCFLSGAVYIFNDIMDIEKDRSHPKKSKRPIANGQISILQALFLFIIIISIFIPLSFALKINFGLVSLGYLTLNILYSLKLKDMVIVDIFSVALGFVLRVIAGIVVIGVDITPWILITTLFLALFISLTKRRVEKINLDQKTDVYRKILEVYNIQLLDNLIILISAATIITYSLFSFISGKNINLMWTIPFVIYGIFRYLYLIYVKNEVEELSILIIKDRLLFLNCILWVVCCIFILYLF